MQLGMIGLGRMGANMARRLMKAGHACVVYDQEPANVEALAREGAVGAVSLEDLLGTLAPPRTVWVMIPAGEPTEQTVRVLGERMAKGDVVIDGGNSHFKDDVRRARHLAERGIHYVDVGTSGGIWGSERGYCLMVGGEADVVGRLEPLFRALAPGRGEILRTPGREEKNRTASEVSSLNETAEEGYLHCGPSGAGHFVKMIHNGIEYGLMQAYAEGFDILRGARSEDLPEEIRYNLNLADIAELWRRGSVVQSWLLDLTAMALAEDPSLEGYTGHVADSGEGRWTILAAIEESVSADVLSASLFARFRSRRKHTFGEKVLSAMRKKFGGHLERPSGG
ncbi:MAG: 6-phosphogluconate dehydrogenase (decarboxylating) [Deltaproteobacteria bacterium RBG_13_65_10]|nr:MAG: 6-phosphogluconate dehydrogenase (decarboxylating) [Deltaproteobacteria bacterium RBG_13_65_10]